MDSASVESHWAPLIRELDERLEPIASRPIAFDRLRDLDHPPRTRPLDEAGIRSEAEALLQRLVDAYAGGDELTRSGIRELFRRFRAFAWAAVLPAPKTTAPGFRARLIHFSIRDQGRDPRDATLWLDDLLRTARDSGIDVRPILIEVAELSSTEDRYGWGSTRDWLLRRVSAP